MAKDRKKLQHIHSSVPDKQPTPASLEVGEIAVNNAKGQEFLSIRNSEDKVVRFSSDEQIVTWMEKKEVMPYEGYVRGEGGPTGTTGTNSVTNNDLLQNKSNIIIKLNQVAANNTVKHNVVNGAKDIYNNLVNPTNDDGLTDGAGFAIDMSRYAMIDANPSFSSLTVTVQTDLNGNTTISNGTSGNTYGTDTGHTFTIETSDVVANDTNWTETISNKIEKITNNNTTIGTNIETISGNSSLTVSGNTIETIGGKLDVTVESSSGTEITSCSGYTVNSDKIELLGCTSNGTINVVEKEGYFSGETLSTYTSGNTSIHAVGRVGITANGDILAASSERDIFITANDNICETAGVNATFYGVAKTNLGLDCSDNTFSTVTNLYGNTIVTSASTASAHITDAETIIGTNNTTISGSATFVTNGTTTIDRAGDVFENNQSDVNVVTSGVTTEDKNGAVVENNLASKEENTTGINTVNNSNSYNVNTSGVTNLLSTGNTNIHSNADICETADVNASFYGSTKTNVGLNCDDSDASTTTNVYGDTINISASIANTTATTAITTITGATTTISTATTTIGTASTNITSASTTATTANYNGTTLNSNITNVTQSGQTLSIDENTIDISSCGHLHINTNDFKLQQCDGSQGSIEFKFCNGFKVDSDNIALEQCTSNGSITIKEKSTTISGTSLTINEGDDVSINAGDDVTINTTGNTNINSTDNTCITSQADADLYGKNSTKVGVACDGSVTSTATVQSNSVTNVYGPTTNISGGTVNISGITNIKNNVTIEGDNKISGATTIKGVLSILSGLEKNLSWTYGDAQSESSGSTNFKENKSFVIPNCASHIGRAKLKAVYGNTSDKSGDVTYDPADNCTNTVSQTIYIPTCVSNLNRAKFGYSYGDVHDKTGNSGTYDPGEKCDNTTSDSIVIPTCVENLTNWASGCFSINNNVCVTGDVTATGSFYSTSDERKKENIHFIDNDKKIKSRNIPLKSFNYKEDATKRTLYGVIAQDVEAAGLQELVHVNEEGIKAVDYTSFLVLRVAYLENLISELNNRLLKLEGITEN